MLRVLLGTVRGEMVNGSKLCHSFTLGLSDSHDSIHYRHSTTHYSNTIITLSVFVRRVGTSKRVFTAHAY